MRQTDFPSNKKAGPFGSAFFMDSEKTSEEGSTYPPPRTPQGHAPRIVEVQKRPESITLSGLAGR